MKVKIENGKKTKMSLAEAFPEIAKEWHPTKNGDLTPEMFTPGSNKKVYWQCKYGHDWPAIINERTSGTRCPYCSGKKVWIGFNDLATTHPDIAKEWHPTKNGKLTPQMVSAGKGKKVWWQCKYGHEWPAEIATRTRGTNCPYCAGKKVWIGFNDLATIRPDIAKEWCYEKNGELTPNMVTTKSNKMVCWKCKYGHEWDDTIAHRTTEKRNCPYCSGHRVLSGFNDLSTTHPNLVKEWHPTKNGKLTPKMFSAGSHEKVWWQCEYSHEWPAGIADRTRGNNCPYCSKNGTSRPELTLLYYLRNISSDAIHRYRDLGFEIDIYIPELCIGVEYDGYRHLGKEKKDITKNKKCLENNIKLYRIREDKLPELNDSSIDYFYKYSNDKAFSEVISKLLSDISETEIKVNVTEDFAEINDFIKHAKIKNSLTETHPAIAAEWHPTKNGSLTPQKVSKGYAQKVWWKCKHGHEWPASVNSRTQGNGCPYCSGKKVWVGFNDLATTYPTLATQWHPTKNGALTPKMISAGIGKEVWWQCAHCGHEYPRSPNKQTRKNGTSRCPKCKTPVTAAKSA